MKLLNGLSANEFERSAGNRKFILLRTNTKIR